MGGDAYKPKFQTTTRVLLMPCNESPGLVFHSPAGLLACVARKCTHKLHPRWGGQPEAVQSQNNNACLQAMRIAQDDKSFPTELPLYVCFNPYFPDKADLSCERRRLEEKLRNGSCLVRGIYLQVACPAHDMKLCPHFLCLHTSPAASLAQDSSAGST